MKTPRLFLLLLFPFLLRADNAPISLVDGLIDGAPFQVALPAEPNGNLLLHAHGYRPAGETLLAELDLEDTAHRRLVDQGWIVATTAYRRNGMIIADAMTDLLNLRDHVETAYGPLGLILLEGRSMGGAIVTRLAESRPDRFHGAVAFGASLRIDLPGDSVPLTHRPKIPLLFVSNQSETDDARNYLAASAQAPVKPVVWSVKRDGHVNLNKMERFIALDALVEWISTGGIEPDRDITVDRLPPQSRVVFEGTAGVGRIIDVTTNHGNVFIDFDDRDFATLGIRTGVRFRLTGGDTTVTIHYGTTFSDVSRGEWISFPTAEGDTIVAINYGNASEQLSPVIGESVRVEPVTPGPE